MSTIDDSAENPQARQVHQSHHRPISSWAEEDRPREKMLAKGHESLSYAELIAILIGSGNQEMNAVQLADSILSDADHNLGEMSRMTIADLMKYKGIGEAKAITIIAAMELGRRRLLEKAQSKPKITCSKDIYEAVKPMLQDLNHEQFFVILLNRANKIMKTLKISSGGVAGTVVDKVIIYKHAIQHLASSIILAHNHPSGNLRPSQMDLKLTDEIVQGASILGIKVLDHIIVTQDSYTSFADEGWI